MIRILLWLPLKKTSLNVDNHVFSYTFLAWRGLFIGPWVSPSLDVHLCFLTVKSILVVCVYTLKVMAKTDWSVFSCIPFYGYDGHSCVQEKAEFFFLKVSTLLPPFPPFSHNCRLESVFDESLRKGLQFLVYSKVIKLRWWSSMCRTFHVLYPHLLNVTKKLLWVK